MAPRPRTPEAEAIRRELQRLTTLPEWKLFVEFSRKYIENVAIDPHAPNVSALLLVQGRRSFHREIIERLSDRVSDERSTNGSGG